MGLLYYVLLRFAWILGHLDFRMIPALSAAAAWQSLDWLRRGGP